MNRSCFSRLCVASTGGGGGKTLLTLGLGRAFHKLGMMVQPFKKGPDYIDAAWLGAACGRQCSNLDPFFTPPEGLRQQFVAKMQQVPAPALALVEGNRGLYDGLDAAGACSTAAVARALACPVVLCVDCAKSTRTIAAILSGLVTFEPGLNFCGVILNNVGSSRHERSLRAALAANGPLPVLGVMPRLEANPLPERHMGLASAGPKLNPEADAILENLGKLASDHCDLADLLSAAEAAPPLEFQDCARHSSGEIIGRVGYVWDDAFWFYYPENLEALRNEGIEPVPINIVRGENPEILESLDGLYLGGGFPEDYASRLSKSPFLPKIGELARQGMPIYAECGGLLLLCAGIEIGGGSYPMCRVFEAVAEICPKPQGLGYVEGTIEAPNPYFIPGSRLKGHEFHYSRLRWSDVKPGFAMRLCKGAGLSGGMDGLAFNNVWASYTHIFAPAVPQWAKNFAGAVRAWKGGQR